ncbi:MAG: M23 family metallopeptidase [Chloroflexi bacterium]|nr:M23 family metallopeptidase [Chloroflexota bacterium]
MAGYRWPLPGGRMYAFFELRDSGFFIIDGQRVHAGIDVATFCGDDILAAHDGTVLVAGRQAAREMAFDSSLDPFFDRIDQNGSLGEQSITVVIDDGNGYRSAYAHLAEALVDPGDVVTAGVAIGTEGATGNASGCHLHYEMIRMDGPWMAVAGQYVRRELYPQNARQRVDPMRVLTLEMSGAPSLIPGIDPPDVSPGLGRPTVVVPDPG